MSVVFFNKLQPTLLDKWFAVQAVHQDQTNYPTKPLSKGECTTMLFIAEFANSKTGLAFPAVATLAAAAGLSERTVKRSLKKLRATGYIEVAKPSRNNQPTQYRLTMKGAPEALARRRRIEADPSETDSAPVSASGQTQAGGDTHVTAGWGDTLVTTGVTSEVVGGDTHVHSDGTRVSPNPTHEPELQARVNGGGLVTAFPTASGGTDAPGGAPPLSARGLRNEWFFEIYPKSSHDAAADAYLTDLLERGEATRAQVEEGAIRFMVSCESQPSWPDMQYVKTPLNWLKQKLWTDRPVIFNKRASAHPKGSAKPRAPATATVPAITLASPDGEAQWVGKTFSTAEDFNQAVKERTLFDAAGISSSDEPTPPEEEAAFLKEFAGPIWQIADSMQAAGRWPMADHADAIFADLVALGPRGPLQGLVQKAFPDLVSDGGRIKRLAISELLEPGRRVLQAALEGASAAPIEWEALGRALGYPAMTKVVDVICLWAEKQAEVQ